MHFQLISIPLQCTRPLGGEWEGAQTKIKTTLLGDKLLWIFSESMQILLQWCASEKTSEEDVKYF